MYNNKLNITVTRGVLCYPAEFGRSRSNGANVVKEIRLKNMNIRVPPFKFP